MKKGKIALIVCAVVGVVLLFIGVILIALSNKIIRNDIDKNLVLKNSSSNFDDWKNPSIPMFFQVYVFNVMNPDEILAGKKPIVTEHGPYTYRERREKRDIAFHDNGTVSYKEYIWYNFERNASAGDETDIFTVPNIPMLTVMNFLRYASHWIRFVVQILFKVTREVFFTKLSVRQLLWEYEDPFLKTLKSFLDTVHIQLDLDDHFGLFYKKNGSSDGVYTMYTGATDISKFAIIDKWNGMSKLPYWTSDTCNMINGSDGTMFPPSIKKTDTLQFFSSDVCRSLYSTYDSDTSLYGIALYHFVPPPSVFANSSVNPDNAGFCTPKATGCLGTGVLNISSCKQGAPIVLSEPHFCEADPKYINAIKGMHPNASIHRTFVDVEPETGIGMSMAKKLQLNVHMQKIDAFKDTANLTSLMFPVVWFNENAKIDEKSASDFKSQVYSRENMLAAIRYVLVGLGSVMILVVLIVVIVMWVKRRRANAAGVDEDGRYLINN